MITQNKNYFCGAKVKFKVFVKSIDSSNSISILFFRVLLAHLIFNELSIIIS